ncbi:hypothetical protein [Bradyrhizobium sp. URHD0069]|uniref:hypothetical protein n=1 Tax=Bradyrhizobium sp. URHD0069 TaxID=1380355 RepID=UPI0012DDF2D9|nr:hypothetical protein [Bradyrhizobium sp. URHD0069]
MTNTATFRIQSVKCRDEMGGKYREKFGNDEIKCAVFSADLRGSTKNSGRINIYDNFDDGDVKTFNPPREVVTLDLAGATGEVELGFSVVLIESQLREGDGLKKAWETFVTVYEEQLKEKLKGLMSPAQARAVAQPGYLSRPDAGRFSATGRHGAAVVNRWTGSVASATRFNTGTMVVEADATTKEKDKSEKVGEAFTAAIVTAVAIYAVKFAGAAVSALIGWSKDKFFPPVAIKAKINASTPPETVPPNGSGVAEFRAHDGIYEMKWDILVR